MTVAVTAVAAFLGALLSSLLTSWVQRKSAREHDTARRREEAFRRLQWAVEQTAAPDPHVQAVGITVLRHLFASDLLDSEDRELVQSILTNVAQAMVYTYTGDSAGGDDVDHAGEDA